MAWWIFQNLVMTTALAAGVAVVCRAGRIGPVARHALWVLVLVKFVTPPLVVWPWAAPDPLGIATLDARPLELTPDTAALTDSPDVLITAREDTTRSGPTRTVVLAAPADTRTLAAAGAAVWPWLLALWGVGSACLLTIEGVRVVRLARWIRAGAPAEEAIGARVAMLAAQMGVTRPVPVVTVAGCTSPAVWGVGRPRLLWPSVLSGDSTDACIDGLLVHELAHIKRGDHLVGWIELAAGVVWWWNPLFWWVRSALREEAELACDGWVISALPNGRRAYAESLLALSSAARRGGSSSMAVVGIRATSRRVLERRLVMIMKGRTPLRLPFVGLCSLALVASATLPAWATSQQPPPPPPASPTPVMQSQQPPPPPPAPAPVPARRSAPAARQVPPPPPPAPRPVTRLTAKPHPTANHAPADMPSDGLTLIEAFGKEQEAIQKEADQKAAASREALTKSLQDLQDRYTKEGKLDEAVVIRNYLRNGGPHAKLMVRLPVRKQ